MSRTAWTIAVEGDSDVAVMAAVLRSVGCEVERAIVCGGKGRLDDRLAGFIAASRHAPWIVLRDLDREPCAPSLLQQLTGNRVARCVRVAVRAVEAWLLADPASATWLTVPVKMLPRDVESVADPERLLLDLARRSGSRQIRADLVPTGSRSVGPGCVDQLRRFCGDRWRPAVAARRSDSLARCLRFLRESGTGAPGARPR